MAASRFYDAVHGFRVLALDARRILVHDIRFWRRLCLPSSNGVFTARAVARAYGALANGGRLADANDSFLSKRIVEKIIASSVDDSLAIRGNGSTRNGEPARLTLGFSPWSLPDAHGLKSAHQCLSHSGMGGFHAYADPSRRLSICVFSNSYEPILHLPKEGGGVSDLVNDFCACVRNELFNSNI